MSRGFRLASFWRTPPQTVRLWNPDSIYLCGPWDFSKSQTAFMVCQREFIPDFSIKQQFQPGFQLRGKAASWGNTLPWYRREIKTISRGYSGALLGQLKIQSVFNSHSAIPNGIDGGASIRQNVVFRSG
jgi:hypothetical protein